MNSELHEIINFLAISDRIGTGGQPASEQFALLQQAGYQVVINLALPTSSSAIAHEGALVAGRGLTYVHIPVVWEAPQREDFTKFLAVMRAFKDQRVFVHCALNMRVSCFIYLYRVTTLNVPEEEAARDLQRVWQPDGVWRAFMDSILRQVPSPK